MHSLAAATAGVSLLALAQPAAGEVVVTRKTIQIPVTTSDMFTVETYETLHQMVSTVSATLPEDITILQDHDKLHAIMKDGRFHKAPAFAA